MSRFSTIIAFLCILGMAPLAQAGFHMEPHVGFGLSNKWEQGSSSGDLSKTITGIKLGYQAPMGLQVGGEIQIGTGTFDQDNTVFLNDIDSVDVGIGPYLGYQSPLGIRGYVGVFRSALALDDAADNTFTGVGFKLGAGYRIIDWFAVNLEYITTSYDKFDNSFGDGDLDPKVKVNTVMLVASFPFHFGG